MNYQKNIKACLLGKAIGGTLGMRTEGMDGPFDYEYYNPYPAQMLPNDDLDLQVLYVAFLSKQQEPEISCNNLKDAWLKHVDFPWDEYGIALRNLKAGIEPPYSGSFDNWFTNGLGGAIRSELWACLAPGNPDTAVLFAKQDACIDHANEGIHAEVFLAALQSMAFVEKDREKLLDKALNYIPAHSFVAKMTNKVRQWCKQESDYLKIRNLIIEEFGSENFTDVIMNLGFIILGWYHGKGDFGKSICIAANCGKDTDCTAASLGALLTIIDPDCIHEKWLRPISSELVISKEITGIELPGSIDELVDMILKLKDKVYLKENRYFPEPLKLRIPTEVIHLEQRALGKIISNPHYLEEYLDLDSETVCFDKYYTKVDPDFFKKDAVLMNYNIQIENTTDARLFFNSHANNRVWLDGKFIFGRECGRMAPSPHRIPINQYHDCELESGKHSISVIVVKPDTPDRMQWVIGVAKRKNMQWISIF
jgi:ADP-ribosylglycohydrolase